MSANDQAPWPRLSRVAIFTLFIAALAGRFSISQIPVIGLNLPDARVLNSGTLLIVVYFWRTSQRPIYYRHPWPTSAFWTCGLIGLLALASFWAPRQARVPDRMIDLAVMIVLIVATIVVTAQDPRRSATLILKLMFATSVVYAVAALAAGPGIQGRYAAFGGGPNVFVRVVCMGVIAGLALYTMSRRKILLLPLPLLVVAAVLSGSRGGLASLVAAGTLFLPVILRRSRTSTALAAIIGGTTITALVWKYVETSASDVSYRFSASALDGNGYSSRPQLIQYAWQTYWDHPLMGAGMDVFWVERGQFVALGYVHNLIGSVAAETGTAGVALLAAAVWAWRRDGKLWRNMPVERLGCALMATFIAMSSMFSGDYYDTRWMWILGILAVNQPAALRTDEPATAKGNGQTKHDVKQSPRVHSQVGPDLLVVG